MEYSSRNHGIMALKYIICVFAVVIAACSAIQYNYPSNTANQPRVLISNVSNMSPSQQSDAADFLKEILAEKRNTQSEADICSAFRERFSQKYHEDTWHVIAYKAYSVMSLKSIELKSDNDAYLLFATKKR